jgi:hypothetical protein
MNSKEQYIVCSVFLLSLMGCENLDIELGSDHVEATAKDASRIDLGYVLHRTSMPVRVEFPIKNDEDFPLGVRIIGTSCGCVTAGILGQTYAVVAPGESVNLIAQLDVPNTLIEDYSQSVFTRVTLLNEKRETSDRVFSARMSILPRLALVYPTKLPLSLSSSGHTYFLVDVTNANKNDDDSDVLDLIIEPDSFAHEIRLLNESKIADYTLRRYRIDLQSGNTKSPTNVSSIVLRHGLDSLPLDIQVRKTEIITTGTTSQKHSVLLSSRSISLDKLLIVYDHQLITVQRMIRDNNESLEVSLVNSKIPFVTSIKFLIEESEEVVGSVDVSAF